MSTKIPTFNEWCKNPTEYEKGAQQLSKTTLFFWTQQCNAIKAANSIESHFHFPPDLAKKIGESALQMVEALLTPEGLAMIGGIMGINFAAQQVFNIAVKQGLAKYFSDYLLKNGIGLVEDGIVSFASANSGTILTGILRMGIDEAIEIGVSKLLLTGVFYAVSGLMKALSFVAEEILPVVGEILMALQIFSMVFDAWDPCHLNDQLTAKVITQMNSTFDDVFRKTMLGSLDSLTDGWGNIYYNDVWPIEFYAENGFFAQEKGDGDYYDTLTSTLCAMYLETMVFNSNGERICIPVDPKAGSGLTRDHLFEIDSNLARMFAADNQVVANWIQRWWPMILFFLLILFALLLIFIFRKSK
jgi:hypothetical protein